MNAFTRLAFVEQTSQNGIGSIQSSENVSDSKTHLKWLSSWVAC